MTRKKLSIILLCLCLAFAWGLAQDTGCLAAEQMYQVSETQLTKLESNNYRLQVINKTQLSQLAMLKAELIQLRQDLSSSQRALTAAQQSLRTTQQYTDKLEQQLGKLRIGKISPAVGYGNKSGFMGGIRYRTNSHYDITVIGNARSVVASVAYNL